MVRSKLRLFITYLEENRNHSFTLAQWQKAIKTFELEEEDILSLRAMARQHKERSDLLRERQDWADAVDELERAFLLSPPSLDHFLQMAILYRVIYENDSFHKKDRQKSLEFLEFIKEVPAYKGRVRKISRDLEKLSHILEPKPRKDRRILFLLIPLFVAVALMLFTQRDYILQIVSGFFEADENFESIESTGEMDSFLPLDTFGIEDLGYRLDLRRSEILDWNGRDAYRLQGDFSNIKGNAEELHLNLRYLDENSRLLTEKPLPMNSLKQGETLPLDYFEYLSLNPDEIRGLSLVLESSGESELTVRKQNEMNLYWNIERPEGVSLKAELDTVEYLEGYDRFYYRFLIVLENNGSREIKDLVLKLQGFGNHLEPFQQESFHPVQADSLPLRRGQRRPVPLLFMVNQEQLVPQEKWVLQIESME